MQDFTIRTEMALGSEASNRLSQAHVAVFGLGGVGSWAAEALARAGVGALTLVDGDTVGLSNLNRQLCALRSTLGRDKAQVMAERILDINPACRVRPLCRLYTDQDKALFFDVHYDAIVDAIDLVSCKLSLIQNAHDLGILCISALGTGNKLDPSGFTVTDIARTKNCPLARVVRKELRTRGILHHRVVFSPEEPLTPLPLEAPPPGRRSIPASVSWVPPVAGFLLAGAVVQDLLGNKMHG